MDYQVLKAALIPHTRVVQLAKRTRNVPTAGRFLLRDNVWSVPELRDVRENLRKADAAWAAMLVEQPLRT